MSGDYECALRIDREHLTLKGFRDALAAPDQLPGSTELRRVNARELAVCGQGDQLELRFTLTVDGDVTEAADRAAHVVRTLARRQRLLPPWIQALSVTRLRGGRPKRPGQTPRARTYYVRAGDGTVTDHPTLAECGRRAAEVIRVAVQAQPAGEIAPVGHPDVFLITGELESRDFPRDWSAQQIGRFVAARDRALGIRDE
jgi:hypothetical protein